MAEKQRFPIGCLALVLLFLGLVYFQLNLSLYRDSQWDQRHSRMYAAWYDNDFATAVEEGRTLTSRGFLSKEQGRLARAALDEEVGGALWKARWFGKILYFISDWDHYKGAARAHLDAQRRDVHAIFILALIKAGEVDTARAAFEEYKTICQSLDPDYDYYHPVISANRPFFDETVAGFLAAPEDPAQMARIDMLNLMIAGKDADGIADYGPSPWGTPYALYSDENDPLNAPPEEEEDPDVAALAEAILGDSDPRDPHDLHFPLNLPATYVLHAQRPDGGFLGLAVPEGSFIESDPRDYFAFLPRLLRFQAEHPFQTMGSALSAFYYLAQDTTVWQRDASLVPIFVSPDRGISEGWNDLFSYIEDFRSKHDDWQDRIHWTVGDSEADYPSHKGHLPVLIEFGGESSREVVLPFTYGDPDLEGPRSDPRHLFWAPPEELNTEAVRATIRAHVDEHPGAREAVALTRRLIAQKRFRSPLQAAGIEEGWLFFPRRPEKLPSWLVVQHDGEAESHPAETLRRVVQTELAIPAERLRTTDSGWHVRATPKDIEILLLEQGDAAIAVFTDGEPDEARAWGRDLLKALADAS